MRHGVATLLAVAAVALGAPGEAFLTKTNCINPAYKKAHSAECRGVGTGFGFPGGDDDPEGGLLDVLRRIAGGIF